METRSKPRQTSVGDLRRLSLTVTQVAQLLKIDANQVRRAIDRRVIHATVVRHKNRPIRMLDGIDVLFLRMHHVLHHDVRESLYAQIKHASGPSRLDGVLRLSSTDRNHRQMDGIFNVIQDLAAETVNDIGILNDVSQYVDGEGWMLGANVESHRIAALIRGGMSVNEVLSDYPNLTEEQVHAAVRYAEANPKPGRPFPSRTVKSVLRTGGGGLAAAFADFPDIED